MQQQLNTSSAIDVEAANSRMQQEFERLHQRLECERVEREALSAERERFEREEAERAAEAEREERRRRREREEAERKEQVAERKRAAAERKKREKAEKAAEEERMQRENAELSQEVMRKVLKAKQREREEQVLCHWHGRCVALDYDPDVHDASASSAPVAPHAHAADASCAPILNSTCPVCLGDFERGDRIWRLPCSHAGCDDCFSSLMRLVGQGGTATRDFGCPLCRTQVLSPSMLLGGAETSSASSSTAASLSA